MSLSGNNKALHIEIPLIMNNGNSPIPTLDSTRLLARAALDRAVAGKD